MNRPGGPALGDRGVSGHREGPGPDPPLSPASSSVGGVGATIGIDVGGTKMLGVVLGLDGTVTAEARVPTPRRPTVGEAVRALGADLVMAAAAAGVRAVAVGIGLPGQVDIRGRLHLAANLPQAEGSCIPGEVGAALGLPTIADNDGTCTALAEWRLGAARGRSDVVVITVGTGIGGGVVAAGSLVRGHHRFAGEPGHMVVEPGGVPCGCGRYGCWEQYASGGGLGRIARRDAAEGRLAAIVTRAGGDPAAVRGEHVTAAAAAGDPEARALLDEVGRWLAVGIANLGAVLDPEIVVVGGGLVEAATYLLEPARNALRDPIVAGRGWPAPEVVPAALGPSAGAVGAALLARELIRPESTGLEAAGRDGTGTTTADAAVADRDRSGRGSPGHRAAGTRAGSAEVVGPDPATGTVPAGGSSPVP